MNEESVVAFCLLTVFYGIFKYGGPMYKDWSDTTVQKFKDILNTARAGHAEAVKTRIEDVKPLSNVVEITKQLFEVSKVQSVLNLWYDILINDRKQPNWRLRLTNSNKRPLWPLKPEQSWIHGFDMKVRSKLDNKKNSPTVSLPKSTRSWTTQNSFSKS